MFMFIKYSLYSSLSTRDSFFSVVSYLFVFASRSHLKDCPLYKDKPLLIHSKACNISHQKVHYAAVLVQQRLSQAYIKLTHKNILHYSRLLFDNINEYQRETMSIEKMGNFIEPRTQ